MTVCLSARQASGPGVLVAWLLVFSADRLPVKPVLELGADFM
jgi:hypothetical protein